LELLEAANAVRSRYAGAPQIGVVLGSGLGGFADELAQPVKIAYSELPHVPDTTVPGHPGNLCFGRVGSVAIACLQGRVHAYEGQPMARVVFGVRLLAELGCRAVLLTNAAGGIAQHFAAGDLMLIVDHINLMGDNPLIGPPDPAASRFVDLTAAYDRELGACAERAAREQGVELRQGVYAAMLGPSYETPSEIRMLRALGADAVGMSTVPEVIALRQRGVRVAALSCITNLAAGLSPQPLAHAEVERVANEARVRFSRLLRRWIELVCEDLARVEVAG
jgi:purine-nucleoside phosphorylase